MPEETTIPYCPCGSQSRYADCCQRYHAGENAPTPEALMRSRFTAFVLKLEGYLRARCTSRLFTGLIRGGVICRKTQTLCGKTGAMNPAPVAAAGSSKPVAYEQAGTCLLFVTINPLSEPA